MMFGSDGPADSTQEGARPQGQPAAPARGIHHQQQTPVPSLRWAHTMFRSHRQHAGFECRHLRHRRPWRWWSPGAAIERRRRYRSIPPSHFFILLMLPYIVPWGGASASAIGGLSPTTLFSSSQTPDARLRAAIATQPKFRSPGLHLELLRDLSFKARMHFYLWPILILAHVPFQTVLDFNAVYILIE
jgi:hypothetical protein